MAEDLFDYSARAALETAGPLAERMRPRSLAEFVGQPDVLEEGSLIRHAIENDRIFSMILWGPPGCGKTTLARIIAGKTASRFVEFSAVLAGVRQIRTVIDEARHRLKVPGKRTLLFVDEIHRFNKAQQDAFLPHVESGLITLIGSTTENPSFEVIPALMSRCRVITLAPLGPDALADIVRRAVGDSERGLGAHPVSLTPEALSHLVTIADGDARAALNGLEAVASMIGKDPAPEAGPFYIDVAMVEKALQRRALVYDKSGESHYNLISAFHKSMRGSDPDAALYWLGRMMEAGEDPLYILRRMVRFASEDVGNADPRALSIALDAMQSFRFLGHPEGDLAIAQAAVYLAAAPKSNRIYTAYGRVKETIAKTGSPEVPHHLRNAPTGLMKNLGYGDGYRYAHDHPGGHVPQRYLPDALAGRRFYHPTGRGFEKRIQDRMALWSGLKRGDKNGNGS